MKELQWSSEGLVQPCRKGASEKNTMFGWHIMLCAANYTNPGYGLSLVDTLWNAGSYRQPLEQEGNPMT